MAKNKSEVKADEAAKKNKEPKVRKAPKPLSEKNAGQLAEEIAAIPDELEREAAIAAMESQVGHSIPEFRAAVAETIKQNKFNKIKGMVADKKEAGPKVPDRPIQRVRVRNPQTNQVISDNYENNDKSPVLDVNDDLWDKYNELGRAKRLELGIKIDSKGKVKTSPESIKAFQDWMKEYHPETGPKKNEIPALWDALQLPKESISEVPIQESGVEELANKKEEKKPNASNKRKPVIDTQTPEKVQPKQQVFSKYDPIPPGINHPESDFPLIPSVPTGETNMIDLGGGPKRLIQRMLAKGSGRPGKLENSFMDMARDPFSKSSNSSLPSGSDIGFQGAGNIPPGIHGQDFDLSDDILNDEIMSGEDPDIVSEMRNQFGAPDEAVLGGDEGLGELEPDMDFDDTDPGVRAKMRAEAQGPDFEEMSIDDPRIKPVGKGTFKARKGGMVPEVETPNSRTIDIDPSNPSIPSEPTPPGLGPAFDGGARNPSRVASPAFEASMIKSSEEPGAAIIEGATKGLMKSKGGGKMGLLGKIAAGLGLTGLMAAGLNYGMKNHYNRPQPMDGNPFSDIGAEPSNNEGMISSVARAAQRSLDDSISAPPLNMDDILDYDIAGHKEDPAARTLRNMMHESSWGAAPPGIRDKDPAYINALSHAFDEMQKQGIDISDKNALYKDAFTRWGK